MKVIAIDPGYDRLGVAVLEHRNNRDTVLFSTCIESSRSLPLHERLYTVGQQLTEIMETYRPTSVAVETLFFNKNITTAIGVAQARGMILYIGKLHGCAVHEFGPQEVKVAVTGYGKSDKTAVIAMVKRLAAQVPEKAHDDEYDAIAVGITCLAHKGATR